MCVCVCIRVRSYMLHINIHIHGSRMEWSGGTTECIASRDVRYSFSSRWLTSSQQHKKKRKKKEREKGIKASRNSPAISIHPIGRRMDACWKRIQRCKKEGQRVWQRKSLVHGRSTSTMQHIDFIFIPDHLPRRVREERSRV